MMCAERAELDKAESLLLLLLGSTLSNPSVGLAFYLKLPILYRYMFVSMGWALCISGFVHACMFCCFEQSDHSDTSKKENSPLVCFMWKQCKSHNPHISATAWLKWELGARRKEKCCDIQILCKVLAGWNWMASMIRFIAGRSQTAGWWWCIFLQTFCISAEGGVKSTCSSLTLRALVGQKSKKKKGKREDAWVGKEQMPEARLRVQTETEVTK